jgi:hypothetical protein
MAQPHTIFIYDEIKDMRTLDCQKQWYKITHCVQYCLLNSSHLTPWANSGISVPEKSYINIHIQCLL